jgi:type IV secretory pathway TraG/TraD family ATPase VirD4
MFTTILLTVVLAAAFFSAENIVTVIIGGLASMGISQWLKNSTGAYGPAMLILAVIVSVIVGFAALVVSSFWSGQSIDWSNLPHYGTQLFALATIGYNLFLKDNDE